VKSDQQGHKETKATLDRLVRKAPKASVEKREQQERKDFQAKKVIKVKSDRKVHAAFPVNPVPRVSAVLKGISDRRDPWETSAPKDLKVQRVTPDPLVSPDRKVKQVPQARKAPLDLLAPKAQKGILAQLDRRA
jgi:hypothetical protein